MLDRHHVPSTPKLPALKWPTITEYAINSHIPLCVIKNDDYTITKLSIVFDAGNWYTPRGVAHFSALMLPKTTDAKHGKVINAAEYCGAILTCQATSDCMMIHLVTPSAHFDLLLQRIKHMLCDPNYTAKDLALLKKVAQERIKQKRAKPSTLAATTLAKMVFGSQHPYGYTLESHDVDLLSVDAIQSHYQQHAWCNPHVYLSGHVTDTMIGAVIDAFHDVAVPKPQVVQHSISPSHSYTQMIDKQSTQAVIHLGHTTITTTHPDYPALYCTNKLLGGFFGSRLMANIREEKGYTYGIQSYIQPMRYMGYWQLSGSVKKAFVNATCIEIDKEKQRLQTTCIEDQELFLLQNYMTGELIGAFDSPFRVVDCLIDMQVRGQDLSYYDDLYQTIQQLDAVTIQKMAQKYWVTDNFYQVIIK